MKIITCSIEVQHETGPDMIPAGDTIPENLPADIHECFTLQLSRDIDNSASGTAAAIELLKELQRRLSCLNARKTN